MKKLRFTELCQDKNTGTYYQKGDVVEFEDARAFEIMQHNVAEVIETMKSEPFIEKEQEVEEAEEVEEKEQEIEETKEEKPKRGRKPKAEQDK